MNRTSHTSYIRINCIQTVEPVDDDDDDNNTQH